MLITCGSYRVKGKELRRKGLQGPGYKDYCMILPFLKKMGGAFEHNFCPKRWKFEQTNLRKFPKEGWGGGRGGSGNVEASN